jgi:hypothetical protein
MTGQSQDQGEQQGYEPPASTPLGEEDTGTAERAKTIDDETKQQAKDAAKAAQGQVKDAKDAKNQGTTTTTSK